MIARDLTGTGKTLAFCLPIVERLRKDDLFQKERSRGRRNILGVMLAPTRELALQITKELEALKQHPYEFKVLTVYGGVSIERQEQELSRGVDFIVGTTGRLLDHIKRGSIDLKHVQSVVLDEADRMLDMGFQEDVEEIMNNIKTQSEKKPQVVLFSATIPPWVQKVSRQYTENHVLIDLVKDLKNKTAKSVEHLAIQCPEQTLTESLVDVLSYYSSATSKTIIFAQTKIQANDILLHLMNSNKTAEVLHGDINQTQREVTLKRFREGKINTLIATDVAARGLDIPNVDLIIQLQPPFEVESYIHRSGRTARAGLEGK